MSVVLKDKLLDELDKHAEKQGISRSSLINVALETYIEAKRSERDRPEERDKMHEAKRKMDLLAEKLGKWDPHVTIRKFCDSNLNGGC